MQLFFDQILPLREELTPAEFGQLIGALLLFSHDGIEPDFENKTLRLAFALLRGSVERSSDSYDSAQEARAKGGKNKAAKDRERRAIPTAPEIGTDELIRVTQQQNRFI